MDASPLTLHGLSVEGVNQCVHCGLCLAYCPTFSVLGTEMDSPRGRIFLVKSLAEGRMALSDSTVDGNHAEGGHGGSASGGGGSWSATSGGTAYHSTTAYHSSTYYGAHYSTYHPPTTVNYYGSSCGSCGGWSTAGAAAAGAAVGVVAGAAVASANANAAASNAYASGYVAGSAANPAYAMGAIYATLPPGCATPTVQGVTYYLCGNTWFQPSYGANGVYYRVVPTP